MRFSRCQVCNFPVFETAVDLAVWVQGTICPCCGTQYGEDDLHLLILWVSLFPNVRFYCLPQNVQATLYRGVWSQLQSEWIGGGMRFWRTQEQPEHWDAQEQLSAGQGDL